MENVMRITFIGAAAAAAIMVSGLGIAMAQTPSPQPQPAQPAPQTTPPAQMAPATPPATTPPGPAPSGTSAETPNTPEAQASPAAAHPKQHVMSACQRAIKASEKALDKSQASPDTIAQAWQHIESAKHEKGQACKDDAKQAQEML
jgi:DNA polymerase III gamma/tau subunit